MIKVIMPAISSALTSSFPLMPSLKLLGGRPIINNNTSNPYTFGAILTSQSSRLHVKVDDFQDPFKINDYVKAVDPEFSKKTYALDEYVVSQKFLVRLYELDIHQKASLEALLNYTQESGLNLCQSSGLVVGGFGVSKEMSSRNLIWVIGRMQVAVDSYPSWGDIVLVETWCSALSKHSLTCSSRLTNSRTGKKLMRVDSYFLMINEKTRRLSKIPEEIKARGDPYVKEHLDPLLIAGNHDKHIKLPKLDEEKADYIQGGIRPLWFDLDPNQHVNNVKYISWILEGAPEAVRENHELAAITIEYRRECGRENVLQSLSVTSSQIPLEFDHLLCLEDGTEVARARTSWRSRTCV